MPIELSPDLPSPNTVSSASLWRRFAAMLYDGFLLVALSLAYGAAVTLLNAVFTHGRPEDFQPMFNGFLFPAGWMASMMGFYIFFWRRGGQTLGMQTWRIRLVCAKTGSRAHWRQCLIRAVVGPLALGLGGLGYWYRYFNSHGDCLHDTLSGTRVIDVSKNN